MAWNLRITEVSGSETQMIGDPPVATEVDLTPSGRWRVVAQFFDDAAPDTVLYEHEFTFHGDRVNATQALEGIRKVGRKVRDTRGLVTSLQVHIGTAFPLN